MTRAQLKKEIKDLENQDKYLRQDIYWKDEELKRLRKLMDERKQEIQEKVRQELQDVRNTLTIKRSDLRHLEKETEFKLPEELEEFWKRYNLGIDWGYQGLKIKWISDDNRFLIVTNPGGTAGTGTVMGTGAYYYAQTRHWIIDTEKKPDGITNSFCEIEGGRLTKSRMSYMIKMMDRIRNSTDPDESFGFNPVEAGEMTLEEYQ